MYQLPNFNSSTTDTESIKDVGGINEKEELEKIKKTIDHQTIEITSLKDDIDILGSELSKTTQKTIEILAIFTTLFTFISVNVNIFARVSDLVTAIVFMFIMTCCSVVIVSVLLILISEKLNKKNMTVLVLSLAALGITTTIAAVSPYANLLRLNPSEKTVDYAIHRN